jgi:hypothetical protein
MNNRYLKQVILAATLIAPLAWSQTIEQSILSKYYPNYNKKHQCYVATDDQGSTYCLKLDNSKVIETPQGAMMYLLVAGDVFDFKEGEANGSHAQWGYVSMFVVNVSTTTPKVVASKLDMRAGASGNGLKGWTLHQFGPQTYGFLNTHNDMHQGYGGGDYVILTPQGNSIQAHWVGESSDNTGAVERNATSLYSTIKIDRSLAISTGLYPLTMTVNGYRGKTKFKNKVYVIPYNASKKTYIEPNNYPLKDVDY